MSENAIVVSNSFMEPVASIDQALVRYQKMKEFVSRILKEDVDFGTIPGTGSKPALLKPGAEKLSTFFGLQPRFDVIDKVQDWTGGDHGGEPFFLYTHQCDLWRNGEIVGSGIGSCNSWEKKYRYRLNERTCPTCGVAAIIKGKKEFGGGWLCWKKRDGCGEKFEDDNSLIVNQEVGKVKNPDPADQVNTYMKMSQKRSMVAAVLVTVNASDYFTQDIEDYIPNGEYKDVTPATKPEQPEDTVVNGGRSISKEVVDKVIEEGYANNFHNAVNMLKLSALTGKEHLDTVMVWCKNYRQARTDGEMNPQDAATVANEEVLQVTE